jgi:hypothetical protein
LILGKLKAKEDLDLKHFKNKFYEDNIETVVLKLINQQIAIIKDSDLNVGNMKRKIHNNELKFNKLNHNI